MRLSHHSLSEPALQHALNRSSGNHKRPGGHTAPSTPAPPLISEANIDDALKILGLQHHAYLSEAKRTHNLLIPPLTENLEDIHREFERQTFFKAVTGARIVGAARAMVQDGTCYISRVIVHPDLQGCGLGCRLMARIEAQFSDVPRFELFTGEKSDRNLKFYAKLGYREFKRVFRESDKTMLVYMEKLREAEEGS